MNVRKSYADNITFLSFSRNSTKIKSKIIVKQVQFPQMNEQKVRSKTELMNTKDYEGMKDYSGSNCNLSKP